MAHRLPGCVVLLLLIVAGASLDVFTANEHDASGLEYTCFRIPSLLRTRNGSLIAFAEGRRGSCGDHGDVRILRRISNDDGLTWSPLVQVKSEEGHTIGNPAPIADLVTGTLHLLYSRDNRQIFVTRSADGGVTWGTSSNITGVFTDVPVPFVGTGPPGGIQLPNGRLIAALYYNCPGNESSCPSKSTRSFSLFSDDHGSSWQRGANVQPGPTVYMGGESQVAPYGSAGNLAMLMRVRGDFPPLQGLAARAVDHNHALAISSDAGATWSNATLLRLQSTYCQGSLISSADGSLLMSAPSTRNGGRANLTVWELTPYNSGVVDVHYQSTVYSGSSAYSSMLPALQKGMYLNLFERENSGFLTLAKFNFTGQVDSVVVA